MAYLDTDDGGRVYYEHHRGAGLPVVLIHGWGMSGDYWASTVARLVEEGHGAITVWSPGLNTAGTSLAGLAALEKLVDRTGWSVFK